MIQDSISITKSNLIAQLKPRKLQHRMNKMNETKRNLTRILTTVPAPITFPVQSKQTPIKIKNQDKIIEKNQDFL
jgi:hypothetical protein